MNDARPDDAATDSVGRARDRFDRFAGHAYAAGALDAGEKALIAVAAAAAVGDSWEAYAARAREAGLGEEAVREALAVAHVQGGGTQLFWMKEDYDDVLGADWRRELIPEADRAFWGLKHEVFAQGVLERRLKELLAVVVSSRLRCRHCTRTHMERALEAGASRRQVAEALGVLWAVGAAGMAKGAPTDPASGASRQA